MHNYRHQQALVIVTYGGEKKKKKKVKFNLNITKCYLEIKGSMKRREEKEIIYVKACRLNFLNKL